VENKSLHDRIFWNTQGWFVCLRHGDEKHTFRAGLRILNVKINEFGVIIGPFQTRKYLENWLDEFLGQHARPRGDIHKNDVGELANNIIRLKTER
jgi:hypothetical protein